MAMREIFRFLHLASADIPGYLPFRRLFFFSPVSPISSNTRRVNARSRYQYRFNRKCKRRASRRAIPSLGNSHFPPSLLPFLFLRRVRCGRRDYLVNFERRVRITVTKHASSLPTMPCPGGKEGRKEGGRGGLEGTSNSCDDLRYGQCAMHKGKEGPVSRREIAHARPPRVYKAVRHR